ncbi:MAG: UMP kinase [Firmicutes bacterium]|nr:UMP kinase [Bacillota bacterium]
MYKRIVLKISGEALADGTKNAIGPAKVEHVVSQLVKLHGKGVQIAVVVGGGNFWRGRQGINMDRVTADHMGMLATIMNALALQDAIEKKGVPSRVQTALSIPAVAEPYILRKALRHFEENRIVIFACGTGNPYFSTDSGAALRAAEIKADVLLMAKNVDGLYDADPKRNPGAKKLESATYMEVMNKELALMDMTAITMCKENNIPIIAFGLMEGDSLYRAAMGEKVGTVIRGEGS